jgi:Zn-dependent protease with chaperone function
MTAQIPFKRLMFRAVLRNVSPMVIRLLAVPDYLDLPDFDEIFRTFWKSRSFLDWVRRRKLIEHLAVDAKDVSQVAVSESPTGGQNLPVYAEDTPWIRVPVRLVASDNNLEPGVFGVFRPVLIIPTGLRGKLAAGQLESVIAHELCHIRRLDNLAALIHMLIEALFWLHPLVWWIGAAQ